MKPWSVSPEEARELARRDADVRDHGGVPHGEVVTRMLADMERELRRLAREYDGSPERSKELLEALVLSEEEGLADVCAEIRHELAVRARAA